MVEIIEKTGVFQLPTSVAKTKLNRDVNAKGEVRYSWEIQIMGNDVEELAKINKAMVDKWAYATE